MNLKNFLFTDHNVQRETNYFFKWNLYPHVHPGTSFLQEEMHVLLVIYTEAFVRLLILWSVTLNLTSKLQLNPYWPDHWRHYLKLPKTKLGGGVMLILSRYSFEE